MKATVPNGRGIRAWRFLGAAVVALSIGVLAPAPAGAHGTGTYTLGNNASFDRSYSFCLEREQHGNFGTQGFSQSTALSGGSCQLVSTYVTACSGLNCPDWAVGQGSTVGTTYQSTANSGFLLAYSHHSTKTVNVTYTYHANCC
jgi:hypothetical protein